MIKEPVLVLVGPTAIGKTSLSIEIAKKFNCEIISMDSMQVYKYLDIGTAKVTKEEMRGVEHYLINIIEPDTPYDANQYVSDCFEAIEKICKKGKRPLITGGTGLYLKSLLEGLSKSIGEFPEIRSQLKLRLKKEGCSKLHEELMACDRISAQRIHMNDKHRTLRALEIYLGTGKPWSAHIQEHKEEEKVQFQNILQIGLTCDRELLYKRINKRSSIMIETGLKDEVQDLLNRGYGRDLKPMQSIGYRHMVEHLCDNIPLDETLTTLSRDTRRYAKRQFTWFNKMDIQWYDVFSETGGILDAVSEFFVNKTSESTKK